MSAPLPDLVTAFNDLTSMCARTLHIWSVIKKCRITALNPTNHHSFMCRPWLQMFREMACVK